MNGHHHRRSSTGASFLTALGVLSVVASFAMQGPALAGKPSPGPAPAGSLADLATDPNPWIHLEANSLQRSPIYMGSTPRELALRLKPEDGGVPKLPASLKDLGELQLKGIYQSLVAKKWITSKQTLTVESWPMRDDRGRLTWAFARWRVSSTAPWRWLGPADILNTDPNGFIPKLLDPSDPSDYIKIFGDPDDYGWYTEPAFGNCIWVEHSADPSYATPIEAWLPTSQNPVYAQGPDLDDRLCLSFPPPARLNGNPVSYQLKIKGVSVTWPRGFVWTPEPSDIGPIDGSVIIDSWPDGFAEAYEADVLAMDGEAPAVFPVSGRVEYFTVKNNALPYNQLADVFLYLEERYEQLGLDTWWQDFVWRDMPQTNLIAEIPGSDRRLPPLLVADHVDTAFDEDLAIKGIYMAVPGAHDNASASSALLRAAEVLKDRRPRRTIWLVHFTGEEFPADDLGARALVSKMLGDRQEIYGLVLLDMIGFAGENQPQFQFSPGKDATSLYFASVGLDAAADISPELEPLFRSRYNERSYLYNTDGIIFSENGYPVVLVNEHLNYFTRLMRAAYHDMGDNSSKMNFGYAVSITKLSIEMIARLAEVPPQ